MAQKTQVILTCDLDEDEVDAAESVTFGFDGTTYTFELCQGHLDEFNDVMQGYVAQARVADGPRRRRPSTSGPGRPRRSNDTGDGVASSDVRAWARDNGFVVSERGRIPAEVRAAFDAAD